MTSWGSTAKLYTNTLLKCQQQHVTYESCIQVGMKPEWTINHDRHNKRLACDFGRVSWKNTEYHYIYICVYAVKLGLCLYAAEPWMTLTAACVFWWKIIPHLIIWQLEVMYYFVKMNLWLAALYTSKLYHCIVKWDRIKHFSSEARVELILQLLCEQTCQLLLLTLNDEPCLTPQQGSHNYF